MPVELAIPKIIIQASFDILVVSLEKRYEAWVTDISNPLKMFPASTKFTRWKSRNSPHRIGGKAFFRRGVVAKALSSVYFKLKRILFWRVWVTKCCWTYSVLNDSQSLRQECKCYSQTVSCLSEIKSSLHNLLRLCEWKKKHEKKIK